jgi:hypothetical protein
MNINRYNYEEFFLLYVDNELTAAERVEVEAFVHDNPDLEEELDMLKEASLKPDTSIRFDGKAALMRTDTSDGLLNETNYEDFFLLYVDDELDAAARREVESFAAKNPAWQLELNLLMQTRAVPETGIVFPDKSTLYKKERTEKPVIMIWWRTIAVAAMVLLALGIFWIGNNQDGQKPGIAKTGNEQKATGDKDNQDDQAVNQPATNNEENIQPTVQPEVVQQDQLAVQQQANRPGRTSTQVKQIQMGKDDVQQLMDASRGENGNRTLASVDVAEVNRNTAGNINTSLETASVQHDVYAKGQSVSTPIIQTVVYTEPEEDFAIANTSIKKNKMRGLFRKVTRVFEKTTNLPGVEEKGILIGSFEIALK